MEIGTLGWSGPKPVPTWQGGLGLDAANPANGFIPIGNGTGFSLATLTGTTNEITVTVGAGTITLSTPQAIGTSSGPTFATLAVTAASNQITFDNNGILTWTPTTARTIILPDIDGTVITTGNLSSISAVGTIASGIWHGTIIGQLYGGTGLDTTGATDGQILIAQTSDHTFALATLTGTTNQVVVANGAHGITLSLPQSINSGATPTFASLSLTAASNQITFDTNGILTWTPTTGRTIILPDVGGTVITTGNLTSITTTGIISSGTWSATTITQAKGGTGIDTSAVTDGQLLIGQTSGNSFGLATLTAGTGITITNGGHSISIATSGSSVAGALYEYANFS